MTVDEFDIRFDILYNNLASNAAPALNAYEKSVFLSQAQRDIIIELYNGRNVSGISFESTEEARAYLRTLIKSKDLGVSINAASVLGNINCYEYSLDADDNEIYFPTDIWFITYETVIIADDEGDTRPVTECDKKRFIEVIPVKQDFIYQVLNNPFKGPSKKRVLRVDVNNNIYLYSKLPLYKYKINYIEYPKPIILKGINDSTLTIDKVKCLDTNSSEGSCPEILHQVILERAVALAKQAYIG